MNNNACVSQPEKKIRIYGMNSVDRDLTASAVLLSAISQNSSTITDRIHIKKKIPRVGQADFGNIRGKKKIKKIRKT